MERATGLTALIGRGEPCILLRADMDALPIREENHLPFRSPGTCSHMCGHDSHAAMLLGAARILKAHENQLTGTVKLMFQPGEETGAGARLMVEAGVLEYPRPQAAFALHVQSVEETGTACCAFGVNSASLDTFILKIRGRGGHSSQPQLCVDPLMILNQVYGAVNLLAAREADPASMVTLTCGVAKGGTAVNIIPDEAELHIGLRTLDPAAAAHLTRRIPELIHHYVKAWGGEYELTAFPHPLHQQRPGTLQPPPAPCPGDHRTGARKKNSAHDRHRGLRLCHGTDSRHVPVSGSRETRQCPSAQPSNGAG